FLPGGVGVAGRVPGGLKTRSWTRGRRGRTCEFPLVTAGCEGFNPKRCELLRGVRARPHQKFTEPPPAPAGLREGLSPLHAREVWGIACGRRRGLASGGGSVRLGVERR